MLKTSSRHVLKTSSRRLEDQQMFAGLFESPTLEVAQVLSMLCSTEPVLIAGSCETQRRLSVSLFSSPFLNHSHFFLSLQHSAFSLIIYIALFLPLFHSVFFIFFLADTDNVLFQVEFSCCNLH